VPTRRPRIAAAALLISPAAILAIGVMLKTIRGPAWLAFNIDPEYAYLFNSLLILKGLVPFMVDHPGTPLQILGAVVMRAFFAATGHGTLEGDVIARAESYIRAVHATALAVSALLVLVTGVVLTRRTSLTDALFVQAAPWASTPLALELARVRPEVLLVGMTVAFAGLVVSFMRAPADRTRFALQSGVLLGLSVALKFTAAPLLLAPVLLLPDWRTRRLFAVTAAAAFLIGIIVALKKLPYMARWTFGLALHAGIYGLGPATVVNPARLLPSLGSLLAGEPVVAIVMGAGLATWLLWRRAPGVEADMPRRVLGAMSAVQVAQFLMVAKHSEAHYIVPIVSTIGVSLCAMRERWGVRWRRSAWAGGLPLGAAALALLSVHLRAEARSLEYLRHQEEAIAATTEAAAGAGHCVTIYRAMASTPAYALQFGNLWSRSSGLRVGGMLTARYPAVLFDRGNLDIRNFDWEPVDLTGLLRSGRCLLMEGTDDSLPAPVPDLDAVTVAISGPESLRKLNRR
jgi:hypothetical protein